MSIAILALSAIWFFRRYLGFGSLTGQIALGMFSGGVVGNLADRILYGHVIDFIDVHLPFIDYRWPAFNIADCGIVMGVCVYIFMVLIEDSKCGEKQSKK